MCFSKYTSNFLKKRGVKGKYIVVENHECHRCRWSIKVKLCGIIRFTDSLCPHMQQNTLSYFQLKNSNAKY